MKSACLTEDGTFFASRVWESDEQGSFLVLLDGPGVFREGLPPDINECFLE